MLRQKYILVIDDETEILDLVASGISRPGFIVEQAKSLDEAKRKMDFQIFDLVITDLQLGKESGFNLIVLITKGQKSNVPVVVMTGYEVDAATQTRMKKELDVKLILHKPFQMNVLRQFLAESFGD